MDTGQIRIGTGRHSGAVMVLGTGQTWVGTDLTCDVVLSDSGLAPRHFTMRPTPDGMVVTAQDGALRVDNETEIAPGFCALVQGDMTLEAGPVRMEVISSKAKVVPRRHPRWTGAILPVLICAALLIGAQAAVTASAPSGTSQGLDTTPEPAPQIAVSTTPSIAEIAPASVPSGDGAGETGAAVRMRLADTGMGGLTVDDSGAAVVVSGVVPFVARSDWAAFQRWFDARWPGRVLQTAGVSLAPNEEADPEFPVIQSVWTMADAPYVVIGGTRVRVGNAINGDWTLMAIDGTSVTLRRGNRDWRLDLIDAESDTAAPTVVE